MNSLFTIRRLPMLAALGFVLTSSGLAQVPVDFSGYHKDSAIQVTSKDAHTLQITWPTANKVRGEMLLDLRPDQPLIQSLSLTAEGQSAKVIATQLDPVTTLTIGERDKKKNTTKRFAAWCSSRIRGKSPTRPTSSN
jgi:hypothetical protein